MATDLSTYAMNELHTVHLTPSQLAERLNMSVRTIYNVRSRGGDLPRAMIYGGRPRWRLSDVIAWEESQLEPMKGAQP
ncbi:helix-turn-helix transcriptional regulator [Glutamicibacter protophormiae]|uniref:helix-turn-helix transcriptional regulator n=1 Tax=Glutamicibacter protophormiae TaxID=37930 RepID=UPI003A901904